MKTTSTPAVEWPPGGAASSSRSASQGRASTDFGALLDTHQARTATAEGPKKHKSPEKTEAHRASKPAQPEAPVQQQAEPKRADAPRHEAPANAAADQQPQAEGDQPAAEAPIATATIEPVAEFVPAPVVLTETAMPVAGEQQQAAEPTQQQVAQQDERQLPQQLEGQAQAAPVEAKSAAPVEAQPAVAPVDAKPQPQSQPQVAAEQTVAAEQPAADSAPEQPVVRADKPAAGQQQPQQQAGDQPRQQQPQAEQRADGPRAQSSDHTVQQQRPAAATEPRADRNQPQPVQANAGTNGVTNAAAPTAPQAAPNRTDAPVRAVPLSRAADAVENVIRLGSQRGVTHARMSLKPAELGGIEIRLQQTANGLTASVVADGAEAAQALQQAGGELRRQLEAQGIQLQSLDISYSGDEQRDARSAAAQTGDGERRSAAGDSSSTAMDGGELTPTEEITASATLELPDGVLVDVLA